MTTRIGLLLVALLGTTLGAAGAQAPPVVTAGGSITGVVSLNLTQRTEPPPRYYRGSYRASHDGDSAPVPTASVVIYVENLPSPAGGWPVPVEAAQMRQHHDRFVPHVLPVLRGQVVSFPNEDNYFHNVFSVVAGDRFDLGRYGQGDTRLQSFEDPAVVVVRCEIHSGMKAFILVRDNPWFTVPDADGRYTLHDVPTGTWTVVGWHPSRASQRRTISVRPDAPVILDISF
ncbi:MAG: carboxypeptidase regulatory-like domain-containing protein [bacterium]|nr:carboxypeptidase regulatory-like domain-containing protein [bacterium]